MRTDSKWVDRRHLTWAPDDAGTIFTVVNILNPLTLHAFAAFIFSLLEIVREITEVILHGHERRYSQNGSRLIYFRLPCYTTLATLLHLSPSENAENGTPDPDADENQPKLEVRKRPK
ncbi:hypothetical protein NMY22_g3457 [Coprinellus aureogranulatus]|nr:hypothetical protein NMY22_g3457 [Coprinellus aureogranulatus]